LRKFAVELSALGGDVEIAGGRKPGCSWGRKLRLADFLAVHGSHAVLADSAPAIDQPSGAA